jgi:lauroyl/myristoyl acyltransferase
MEPALDPATFADTTALVTAVARTSERHIRDHLGQWCIFRPLWEPVLAPEAEPAPATRSAEA